MKQLFPFSYNDPRYVFRLVKRDERAAYVRIMRRTLVVQLRDMDRATRRFGRELGKQLLPVIERLTKMLG